MLFLGGFRQEVEWKESHEARRQGKWVHMGRVNTLGRLLRADRMGCQSGMFVHRTSVTNPIDKASLYLQTHGWIKGRMLQPTGAACMLGALVVSDLSLRHHDAAFDAILNVLARRFPTAPMSIQYFNDHPATMWEDVQSVLAEASAEYEEVFAC
ncbi:MAG: hypothetical protein KGI89_17290 [Euryarchaeota archaeon]|nr:hypothetical protein [Euryarchaeota archaeon]